MAVEMHLGQGQKLIEHLQRNRGGLRRFGRRAEGERAVRHVEINDLVAQDVAAEQAVGRLADRPW